MDIVPTNKQTMSCCVRWVVKNIENMYLAVVYCNFSHPVCFTNEILSFFNILSAIKLISYI